MFLIITEIYLFLFRTHVKYVKAMRKQYNLTQVELSEKSGVGLRLVRELEQGKQTLRLDKVNQILNLFGSEIGVVPMTKTDE